LICDAWDGIEEFLEPGKEVLCVGSGAEVAQLVASIDAQQAVLIGQAARKRILAEHTYAHRAALLYDLLQGGLAPNAWRSMQTSEAVAGVAIK
jgi:spore maturation protein CgeB